MSAMERIEAAIQKLETLKSDSTQGEWWATGMEVFSGTGLSGDLLVVENGRCWADPRLITTLHRTIDPQLAFLRHAVKYLGSIGHATSTIGGPFIDDALALSDAILGDPA